MGLFSLKENYNATLNRKPDVKVHQGFVENSNVSVIQEMTDMIQATRVFESTQKAIKAFDAMDERLVNDIPKL
jgi:flagellar basal-body rod protein FlgG